MRADRCLTAIASLGILAGLAIADEEKIAVKDLPKAVLEAAKEKFPKAEIKGAAKEDDDGETTFEVEMTVAGRSVDVAMKADGTILEIEREIPVEKLPKAVKKAFAKKFPGAEIAKVESITKGEKGPVRYEVAFKGEVVMTAKGKVVDDDDDDDEDDEKPEAKSKKKKGEKEDEEEDDDEKEMKAKKKKDQKDEDEDEEKPKPKDED